MVGLSKERKLQLRSVYAGLAPEASAATPREVLELLDEIERLEKSQAKVRASGDLRYCGACGAALRA